MLKKIFLIFVIANLAIYAFRFLPLEVFSFIGLDANIPHTSSDILFGILNWFMGIGDFLKECVNGIFGIFS